MLAGDLICPQHGACAEGERMNTNSHCPALMDSTDQWEGYEKEKRNEKCIKMVISILNEAYQKYRRVHGLQGR